MYRALIVVGVGGAEVSWGPLSWAEAEASATGGRLLICHAVSPDSALASLEGPPRLSTMELAEPALARAVAAARLRLGGDRVGVVLRARPAGELLVEVASSADMVVLGPPAPRWLSERGSTTYQERGSTTHHVVAHAASPVVVVRPGATASADPGHPPFSGHVVVGVDGSAPARGALEFGFRHASAHRRPLAAVTVVRGPDTGDVWCDDRFGETHMSSPALAELDAEVEPWRLKFPDVAVKRAVFTGRPVQALVRASQRAALLVLGSRGLGPVRRVILGSVSHGAVDRAGCPVAVVHGDEARQGQP